MSVRHKEGGCNMSGKMLSRCSLPGLILILVSVLVGCARSAPQSAGYPGAEWAGAPVQRACDLDGYASARFDYARR